MAYMKTVPIDGSAFYMVMDPEEMSPDFFESDNEAADGSKTVLAGAENGGTAFVFECRAVRRFDESRVITATDIGRVA